MTDTPCGPDGLLAWFGQVDIYLFDQLLRGRITPGMRLLDAGCGSGRNLHYLLRCGADVHGVDRDPGALEEAERLAAELAPGLGPGRFQMADLRSLPHADASFDAVVASAVLHFAEDEDAFEAMVLELWRVLRPGGILFARLASTMGIADRVRRVDGRRFALPDGTERFLVDEPYLLGLGELMGAQLLDPLKTTNVQNQRAMTTWVVRRQAGAVPSAEDAAVRRGASAGLAPLLERIRSALYGLPSGTDAGGEAAPWSREDEEALRDAATGYDRGIQEGARELAAILADLRQAVERPRDANEARRTLLDRAKAALSGLETLVLVADTLRRGEG